ncbi:MAG: hypothetical protein IMHGJWDQ_000110 [Candidatus Fervidibacter sp.]
MIRNRLKLVGAIVVAVIAIALAIFSALRSLRPQGQPVGNLGYLGAEREEALKGTPQGEKR